MSDSLGRVDRASATACCEGSGETVKGDARSGASGRAVRFACFFRIFLVASEVTYWNCRR